MRRIQTLFAAFALVAIAACDETPVSKKDQDSKPAAESKPAVSADPAFAAIENFISGAKIDVKKTGWRTALPKPEKVTSWDAKKTYTWTLETNKGTMKFKFYPDGAPMHVTNFVYLTKLGYFDGLGFHRVVKKFMAQGGCPTGSGSGTPGYRYETETTPKYTHSKRGILSTARTNMRDTDGSQFFIMFEKKDFLDNQYSVFGECVDGLAVLDAIEAAGKDRDPAPPSETLTITKATVAVE